MALSGIIESIYSKFDQQEGWEEILGSLVEVSGAASGCIVSMHPALPNSNVDCFYNIDPEWIEAYNQHYYQYDPTPRMMQMTFGRSQCDHVTGPRPSQATGKKKKFYHEVMLPQNFRHTLFLGLSGDPLWNAGLVLQRTTRQGQFEAEDISVIESLSGHLQRALQLHSRLTLSTRLQESMSIALDYSPFAVLLLDSSGNMVFMNHRAESLMANHESIDIKNGRLCAGRNSDDAALQQIVHNAITTARNGSDTNGGRLWLSNGLHVNVIPMRLPDEKNPFSAQQIFASVWLSEGNPFLNLSPDTLREHFDLTSAEARLLSLLVEGKSLLEIAEIRSIKHETVRGQLKDIKAKLGVSRQADLVRIVLSTPVVSFPVK